MINIYGWMDNWYGVTIIILFFIYFGILIGYCFKDYFNSRKVQVSTQKGIKE